MQHTRKRWDTQEVEALERARLQGTCLQQLAASLGRSLTSVQAKLASLESKRRGQTQRDLVGRIPRKGAEWSAQETQSLTQAFRAGATIEMLVREHQRSTNGVVSKLRSLNLIVEVGRTYCRVGDPLLEWGEATDIDARVYLATDDQSTADDPSPAQQQAPAEAFNAESQLTTAIALLKSVKSNLMHQRCFGQDTLQGYRRACTNAEGDIEQWLIDNGHLHSKA